MFGPRSNRCTHPLEVGRRARGVLEGEHGLNRCAVERDRTKEEPVELAEHVLGSLAEESAATELLQAPMTLLDPRRVRDDEQRPSKLARPAGRVARSTPESRLDDDDHVGERDETFVPLEERRLGRGRRIANQRKVDASGAKDLLEQSPVIARVGMIEGGRRDHDRRSSRPQCSGVRSRVDAERSPRKDHHPGTGEIIRKRFSKTGTLTRWVTRAHDGHRWPARELAVHVEDVGWLREIGEARWERLAGKNSILRHHAEGVGQLADAVAARVG
jgi:hypothetical protein